MHSHLPSLFFAVFGILLGSLVLVHAEMESSEIAATCNALAAQAYEIKDLVATISSNANKNGLTDVYNELDLLAEDVLSDIDAMTGSSTIEGTDVTQTVYEAYSSFVEALFELSDAFTNNAATLVSIDSTTYYRVPAGVEELKGVVDAYFYNLIALFPANTSYVSQSNNQMNQVNTHFRQVVHAFHLIGANSTA